MNRKTMIAILLIMTMLAVPWASMLEGPELEQLEGRNWTTTSFTASQDTMLNLSDPNRSHGGDQNLNLSSIYGVESYLLYSFPLLNNNTTAGTVPASSTINSASITLYTTSTQTMGGNHVYAATLYGGFDEGNTTWFNQTHNTTWHSPGATNKSDHGIWEPRTSISSGASSVTINVTSLAQRALSTQSLYLDLIVSLTGDGKFIFASSEHPTTSKRPTLSVSYDSFTRTNATIAITGPANGSLSVENTLALVGDTTPTMTWTGFSGTGQEIQVSREENFRSENDSSDWLYDSWSNSGFTSNGANGSFTVPSSLDLDEGMVAYWRARSTNSDLLSDWEYGDFLIPEISATSHSNGTATLELYRDSLNMSRGTIDDAWLRSGSSNISSGNNENLRIGHSNTSSMGEMNALFRVDIPDTGMHHNATILSAYLQLRRTGRLGTPWISIHHMGQENWSAEDATWDTYDGVNSWGADGVEETLIPGALDVQRANKSGVYFNFDVTYAVQEYLRKANTLGGYTWGDDGISFLLKSNGEVNEWIKFAGGTDGAEGNRPTLVINYKWGDGAGPGSAVTVQSPLDGHGVWEIVNEHNLTADLTPTLNWSSTGHTSDDVRIELSSNSDFTEGPLYRVDSRDSNSGIDKNSGNFTIPASWGLDYGEDYHWRIRWVEDGDWGDYEKQGMFISKINSTWVSNNTWQIRLRNNNASDTMIAPYCRDTFIDGALPSSRNYVNDGLELTVAAYQYTLFGCDLKTHFLPPGYAAVDAELRIKANGNGYGTSITANAYELLNHRWTEEDATWENYDATNNWSTFGAGGNERGQLLDFTTISGTSNSWVTWNVTTGVQNSMRWNVPVDFLIVGSGSGSAALVMDDKETASSSGYPELVINYRPGSMEVPNPPQNYAPQNGEWSVTDGMLITPELRPTLSWNNTGSTPSNGYVVEMDTTPTFNSANLRQVRSWDAASSSDFDLTNLTYTPSTNLSNSNGKVWYWHVRGSSQTNQLGNWSNTTNFIVPEIESGLLDADNSYMVVKPGKAVASQNIPNVPDTWIDGGSNRNVTHYGSQYLAVGCTNTDCPKTSLISFPLDELPKPTNSRIVSAELSLMPYTINGTSPRISVHRTLKDWNESVNGISADGDYNNSATNWSQQGGIGNGDIGPFSDIGNPPSAQSGSRFILNVTEIVHDVINDGDSYVNMTLMSDTNSNTVTMFHSADTPNNNNIPYLTIWYRSGTGVATSVTPILSSPADNSITWNVSGHLLGSENKPTLSWTHPTPSTGPNADNWRLFIYNDSTDVREGFDIIDSRFDSGFDLTNLTWTPQTNFSYDSQIRWFVQTITDDIYGERSGVYSFDVPNQLSREINSTDAQFRVHDGAAVSRLSNPNVFADTRLDTYSSSSNYGSNQALSVGRSIAISGANYKSWTVMRVNISSMPIPEPWKVISANLDLFASNTGSSPLNVSLVPLNSDFNEMQANNSYSQTNITWPNPTTGSVVDTTTITGAGWYSWNVTQLLQAARTRGDDTMIFAFTTEIHNNTIKNFHSSEYTANISRRPSLEIVHRTGNQWLPEDVSNPIPATEATLWQAGEPRPTSRNPITIEWSHSSPTNITSWQIELSASSQFTEDMTKLIDSNIPSSFSGTFGSSPLSYTISASDLPNGWTDWEDAWLYWRVRPVVDSSFGNWTEGGQFRVPDDQGSDDGLGNHTVTLVRGSIFENSGLLPSVPDTWIDSTPVAGATSQATNSTLNVGNSVFQSGHQSVALLQFDLGELPFPQNMLATTVSLKLYRINAVGSGNAVIGIHECTSFNETDTWNSYSIANNCNSTASSTLSQSVSNSGMWYEWDITTIVQNAGYNGAVSIAVQAQNFTGHLQFASSEVTGFGAAFRPQLIIGYVDNVNGLQPPSTPVLIWPADQQVLYNIPASDSFLLESPLRPTLTWNYPGDTTGYVIRLWNSSTSNIYYSWSATVNQGTFGQSNFTTGWDMEAGGLYYWNIQGINGSVLGPRSSTWSFAIGNPSTQALGNNLWSSEYQEGNDVGEMSHPSVLDSTINEGSPSSNYGEDGQLRVGVNCNTPPIPGDCISIIQIDLSQIPLTANGRAHSGHIQLWLDSMNPGMSSWIDISAYALLNHNYSENQATWLQASLGNNWSSAGLSAGNDYGIIALDTVRISSTSSSTWVNLDVSNALSANLNGTLSIVLIGDAQVPIGQTTGMLTANFESSESTATATRPKLVLNYTNVYDITVTGPNSTIADNQVQFTASLFDVNNNPLPGAVEWSTSNGDITSNGLFTPEQTGNITITARFGRIVVSHIILVQPGAPVLLIGGPPASTITSDESVSLWFDVLDANNNSVPGITLSLTVSNGSIAQGYSHTTPVGDITYMPWTVGLQTVNITWSGGFLSLEVTVNQGIPDYIIMTGNSAIAAGESHDYNWTSYDAHNNLVNPTRLLSVNWTVEDGNISQTGNYTADKIGFWNVTLNTGYGISATMLVETTHGLIHTLEVTPSSNAITADDEIFIYTVRIDIRGNRLNVTLPSSSWAVTNGTIHGEDPVRWTPWSMGPQAIDASLEGVTSRVIISVTYGEVVGIEITSSESQILTSGDSAHIEAKNFDQYGNEWTATIDSWSIDESMADQNWLDGSTWSADFDAIIVGDWTVTATYIHNNGSLILSDSIMFTVEAGPLSSVTISGQGSQLTADDSLNLNPITRDHNSNMLQNDILRWFIWDADSTQIQPPACIDWGNEITEVLQSNNYNWEASTEGNWRICAISGAYQAIAQVSVSHGEPAVLYQESTATSLIAGATISIEITAADSDGNIFAVDVNWTGSPSSYFTFEEEVGKYSWHGTVMGNYDLEYTHSGGLTGTWSVTVNPSSLATLEMTITPGLTVNQQDTITVNVQAFDAFGNEIPVPNSAVAYHGGELHQISKNSPSQWEVYMVDEGKSVITVVSDADDVYTQQEVLVEQTFFGFFEQGGTIYYVGAGLGLLIVISLFAMLGILLKRSGSSTDDDDDFDFYDEEYDEADYQEQSNEEYDSGEVSDEEHEDDQAYHDDLDSEGADTDEENAQDISVDEDGTEWWEDEEGVWWYRSVDMDDWEIWED